MAILSERPRAQRDPAIKRSGERAILTVRSIEQVRPAGRRREIADAHLPGFYFIVQPSGAKSWAVRYRFNGRTRKFTIGAYPKLRLGDARELARSAFRAVAEGRDPMAERQEARRRTRSGLDDRHLFERVWEEYRKRHVANLRSSTARECERLFSREILPLWRKRRLTEISKQDILDLLDNLVDRGAPTTANHTFGSLRTFFNWTLHRNLLMVSPCTGIKKPHKEQSRDRRLSDDEVRWLWWACDELGFPFGPLTKLLLLTGTRRDEVRAMTERELKDGVWTIPAARTKNGLKHEIVLPGAALALLDSLPRVGNKQGFVFCTNGETAVSGFTRAKRNLDRRMLAQARKEVQERGDDPAKVQIEGWVVHDLRRTVASGMQRLGIALPLIEKCLNHVSGSFAGIAGVYQRHTFKDEKRAAFAAWAQHVERVVSSRPATNVIALRA